MTEQHDLNHIQTNLQEAGQEHLLAYWDDLTAAQRETLLGQIEDLDLKRIPTWVREIVQGDPAPAISESEFEPAPAYGPQPRTDADSRKYTQAVELGKELISAGKVAGFVVAGGQGTRLGFDGPKGNYPITPIENKTLFEVFAETIKAVSDRYGAVCPWYVMTSPLNHADTVSTFESNNYYDLGRDNVCIFQQGTLPNFAFDGKILMAEKHLIARSPDGHGGAITALKKSGALADMKRRGVQYLSYWQVDNPLVKLFDPLFIGLHAMDASEMSSRAVYKNAPKEKVGNFCLVDGKVTVIEYSDLPDRLAEKRDDDGSLAFHLGSIAIHVISTDFLEKLTADGGCSLPLHRAVKKIPHLDERGQHIEPTEPNGVKLESFIFDALPLANHSMILEVERSEQFAPTKNATGVDSAETTRQMMVQRAAKWLESAGVKIPRKPDGSPDCTLEMTPGFALDPDDVAAKLDQVPKIEPGDSVYLG